MSSIVWKCDFIQKERSLKCIHDKVMRRYPWGIQQLVSTHHLPHKSLGVGYSRPIQIFIFWGAGDTPDQLKSKFKVPQCGQIFIWRGEGYSRPTQIPSAKSWPSFHWGGGGWVGSPVQHSWNTWVGAGFCSKNSRSLACLCITDSLSPQI